MKHFAGILLWGSLLIGAGAASGQGIRAGQTAGMRVVRPNNVAFYCSTSNTQCQQLDADGDGTVDFNLVQEYGSSIRTMARSLFPATWQVLQDSSAILNTSEAATPLAVGEPIGPRLTHSAWRANGQLVSAATYAGRLYEVGNWANIDTTTLYLGIRHWQGGAWHYGYLQTKRLLRYPMTPINVTAYAIQNLVTATQNPQLVGVELYPNPTQAVLQVTYPKKARLRIYNAVGSLQHEEEVTTGAAQISVAKWAGGIYLLRLENEDGVYTSRFQKME